MQMSMMAPIGCAREARALPRNRIVPAEAGIWVTEKPLLASKNMIFNVLN